MAVAKRTPAPAAAGPRAVAPQGRPVNTPAPAGGQVASLNPEDWTQGGLLDDIDVTFKEVRWVEWDYNGTIDTPVLALLASLEYEDQGKVATQEQYYSAGDLSKFQPSADGRQAISVGGAKGLNSNTNAGMLIKSFIDAGFPQDKLGTGDVGAFDGTVAHINRVAQPKRGGRVADKNSAGFDLTVAVITKIHKMPWETTAGKTAAKPVATRPTTKAPLAAPPADEPEGEAGEMDVAAAEILLAVLEAKKGTVAKSGIAPGSFKALSGNTNRAAILALITNADWLMANGENFGWSFDGTTVTAG